MATNFKSLQLLRNTNYAASKEAAIALITGSTANVSDGSIKLARYYTDATSGTAKTIFGVFEGTKNSYTIYDSADNVSAEILEKINAAISGLSATEAGQYVSGITVEDGVATVGTASLDTDKVAFVKTDGSILSADTITTASKAFEALEDAIEANKAAELTYKTRALTEEELSQLTGASNVREAYKTVALDKDGNEQEFDGDVIKVYKDNALSKVELTHSGNSEYLHFEYINAEGVTTPIDVEISKFLSEAEFKDGLVLSDDVEGGSGHTVSVKLDTTADSDSAKFLYMKEIEGGNGAIALSGISEAIAAAAASAKTVVTSVDESVAVSAITADGEDEDKHVTYDLHADGATIKTKSEILSGKGATFIESGKTMDEALQAIVDEVIANEQVEAAAIAAIQSAAGLDKNLGYTKKDDAKYIGSAKNMTDAINILDEQVANALSGISGLDYSDAAVTDQYVTSVSETDGVINVTRGGVYASGVSATAIEETETSVAVTGDTVKAQIESLAKTAKANSITAGNKAISVVSGADGKGTTVSLVIAPEAEDNANDMLTISKVEGKVGLTLSDVWNCGEY